jgi:hypothetical protein
MPQSERTDQAMNAFWVCLEELILAHRADKQGEPAPIGPSKWESFWKHFPIIVGIPTMMIVFLFLAFDAGVSHQKSIGPRGSECKAGTYRQPEDPGGAAICTNGFWEVMLPPCFPPRPEKNP